MIKFKLTIVALLVFTASAHAEMVEKDWKVAGDGLATLDTVTGIEWLDLTQADGISVNQAESLTEAGGALDGWRLPTRAEVKQMMVHSFPSRTSLMQRSEALGVTDTITDNEADRFRELFGATDTGGSNDFSVGMFKSEGTVYRSGFFDRRADDFVYLYSNVYFTTDYNYIQSSYGVYVVSDGGETLSEPEPEPSSGSGVTLASDFVPSGTGDNEIRFAY